MRIYFFVKIFILVLAFSIVLFVIPQKSYAQYVCNPSCTAFCSGSWSPNDAGGFNCSGTVNTSGSNQYCYFNCPVPCGQFSTQCVEVCSQNVGQCSTLPASSSTLSSSSPSSPPSQPSTYNCGTTCSPQIGNCSVTPGTNVRVCQTVGYNSCTKYCNNSACVDSPSGSCNTSCTTSTSSTCTTNSPGPMASANVAVLDTFCPPNAVGGCLADFPAWHANTLSGHIYDSSTNQLFTGPAPQFTITGDTSPGVTVDSPSHYSLGSMAVGNSYTLTLNDAGYVVDKTNPPPSVSGSHNFTVTAPPEMTLDWYIHLALPWYQTDHGDVRFNSLSDELPATYFASGNDPTNPASAGIMLSSKTQSPNPFGSGGASNANWNVSNEYGANSIGENNLGSASYTFYKSRMKQAGITPTALPADLSGGLASGIYESAGNLTISNYVHKPGQHVVILVPGDVTISKNITVLPTANNLFIVAAKGNIVITKDVGLPAVANPFGALNQTALDGFYSAEKGITIQHDPAATCPTEDKQLRVGGALIANALYPYAVTGANKIDYTTRTLCTDSLTMPVLTVQTRLDFLTQLTDFYKQTNKVFKEVNP